jgi:hypothetical protein
MLAGHFGVVGKADFTGVAADDHFVAHGIFLSRFFVN